MTGVSVVGPQGPVKWRQRLQLAMRKIASAVRRIRGKPEPSLIVAQERFIAAQIFNARLDTREMTVLPTHVTVTIPADHYQVWRALGRQIIAEIRQETEQLMAQHVQVTGLRREGAPVEISLSDRFPDGASDQLMVDGYRYLLTPGELNETSQIVVSTDTLAYGGWSQTVAIAEDGGLTQVIAADSDRTQRLDDLGGEATVRLILLDAVEVREIPARRGVSIGRNPMSTLVLPPNYDWISKDAARVTGCQRDSVTVSVTSLNGADVFSAGATVKHCPRGASAELARGETLRFPGGPPDVELKVV